MTGGGVGAELGGRVRSKNPCNIGSSMTPSLCCQRRDNAWYGVVGRPAGSHAVFYGPRGLAIEARPAAVRAPSLAGDGNSHYIIGAG